MPIVREQQALLESELLKLSDTTQHLSNELEPIKTKIPNVQIALKQFILDHFTSLIRQVKGTDLNTFNDFYESEIGADGVILNAKIELEFTRQFQSVSSSLYRIGLDFENEMTRFETSVGADLAMKCICNLKNIKLDNGHILAARNGIVSVGKMVGLDLAKYMKFKPWGAVNFAAKATAILNVVALIGEAVDSYKKSKAEEDFRNMVKKAVSNLELQRQELLDLLVKPDFIDQFFPAYKTLQENLSSVLEAKDEIDMRKKSFNEWQQEGVIIEGEYKILRESHS